MEISRLASKSKRIQDWRRFLSEETSVSPGLRSETESLLSELAEVLSGCWDAKKVSESDEQRISDLERRLEELNEQGRLRTSNAR